MRLGIFIVGVMAAVSAAAQVMTDDLQDRAVEWTQEYLRVNTVNPPGNEIAGREVSGEHLRRRRYYLRDGGVRTRTGQYLGSAERRR